VTEVNLIASLEVFCLVSIKQLDELARSGKNKDIPPDAEVPHVRILRQHFPNVFRKRVSTKSTEVVRHRGEDIWIVGALELPRSQMIELAEKYRPISRIE
jgi:hypothetical protein